MTDSMLPNETLQSQLSAFVDEELPEAETDLFVRRLVKDVELKQTMGRYQLMGEALRAPTLKTHLSRDFSARIAAALEQDSATAQTAAATIKSTKRAERWLKPAAGMAVAASVALVAVLMVRNQPAGVQAETLSADALQPVVLTAQHAAVANSYVVPTAANAPTAPIPAARLTNYVVAHSEFSSPLGRRNMMTGLLAGDQPVTKSSKNRVRYPGTNWMKLGIVRFSAAASCLLVGAIAFAGGSSSSSSSLDARGWLERMSQALVERNYDGRYIHSTDAQSETMRIVHRNLNGKITERLVSLDGSGREMCTNTEVTYYMPDKRAVLVESRVDSDALLTLIPEYQPGLEAYYDISTGPVVKVLERKAQLVTVQPRDEYRYGYRLWLDAETAMPLKSQLFDRQGKVIEQVAFAELALRDRVPNHDLTPTVNTAGFEWTRHEVRRRTVTQEAVGWRVQNLPPGFKLKVTRLQPVMGSTNLVRHLVYSDGLATVSMFIEQVVASGESGSGLQKVGSAYAFHNDVQGFQITAVGEVPAVTVKNMVSSLAREPAVARK